MKEIEKRIFVSDDILLNEFSYIYGENKDVYVIFQYYQVKKDKLTVCHINNNYKEALDFARYRRNDKRYKNFEFFITINN